MRIEEERRAFDVRFKRRPRRADQLRDGRTHDEDLAAFHLRTCDFLFERTERPGDRHFGLGEFRARDVLQVRNTVGVVDDGDGRHHVAADRSIEHYVRIAERSEDLHRARIATGMIEIGHAFTNRGIDDIGLEFATRSRTRRRDRH